MFQKLECAFDLAVNKVNRHFMYIWTCLIHSFHAEKRVDLEQDYFSVHIDEALQKLQSLIDVGVMGAYDCSDINTGIPCQLLHWTHLNSIFMFRLFRVFLGW